MVYLGWYQQFPSKTTINLLAILSSLALAWFSPTLGLLLSMINLIVVAGALKLMLLGTRKDFLQLVCTTLFIIGCGFIFHQSVVMTLVYCLCVFGLLFALANVYAPSLDPIRLLKHLGVISLQALPITILLFLILPQLPPLWKMPTAKSTETGLTDTVSPGDIASLSQSAELAFRATFQGQLPPQNQRYWRAITLEKFNGKTWSISPLREQKENQYRFLNQEFSPRTFGHPWDYEIIAEASGKSWLFALDLGVPANRESHAKIWQTSSYELLSETPIMTKTAYQLQSYPQTPLNQTLASLDKSINLQLPNKGNPLTQAWVTELRQQYTDDKAFIDAVMNYFSAQNFVYTLQPAPMPDNSVDRFLFDEKAGFCSHYASAMAYVLRLAGIPARMVAGYHGGENLRPDVLSVYQYDAHAWIEAWYDETGWVRYDPTAVVAPDRLQFGLQQAMEGEGSFLADNQFAKLKQVPLFASVHHFFSNMDYLWSRWVLGFDASRQQDLFTLILGKLTTTRILAFVFTVFLMIGLLLALYFLPQWYRRPARPPLLAQYLMVCSAIENKTQVKREKQSPANYATQCGLTHPQLQQRFQRLTEHFEYLYYSQLSPSPEQMVNFKANAKEFLTMLKKYG
jgi:transglutaminase-like putative cysteine protease